jgi:hypothetical protein
MVLYLTAAAIVPTYNTAVTPTTTAGAAHTAAVPEPNMYTQNAIDRYC